LAKKSDKKIIFEKEKEMPPFAISFYSMEFNKTENWRNFRPRIDYDKCSFCLICWKSCPEAAIGLKKTKVKGKEELKPVIDYEYCKGCGICWEECPTKAIDIEEEAD
jgi:2-oxoacid:acceptor oxidoreductase delta subunit (pyruvate/2-ketoisovalerate family)